MKVFPSFLSLLSVVGAVPLQSTITSNRLNTRQSTSASSSTPRLVLYAQNLQTATGGSLDFTQLVGTGVTHVIISSFHVLSNGTIHLNNAEPSDPSFNDVSISIFSSRSSSQKFGLQFCSRVNYIELSLVDP